MNKEFICYMDAKDYRDMHKGTIKWCAVGTKPSENDTDVKLFASLPPLELTDEEIKFIAYPFESIYTTYDKQTDTDTVHTRFDQLGFAKALLRKAQE